MSIVKLNVGGHVFTTTHETAEKLLAKNVSTIKDDFGVPFIDRDFHHFGLILNHLRDGHVELPNCRVKVKEIQKEAEFYGLKELEKACEDATAVRVLESKNELFTYIMKAKRDVLVYYYPTTFAGQLSIPFGISDFQEHLRKYKAKYDIVFLESDSKNGMGDWSFDVYKYKMPQKPSHVWNGQVNFFADQDSLLAAEENRENDDADDD